jgi:AcrR family transcriptional regulator
MTTETRPLRKDAERNRQLILDAARELFAERGLGVTLNDIAHHAGVGVGTVYRRFPDKALLIDSLFEQRVGDVVVLADAALEDPDPWRGLTTFLERALELQAGDRAFKELVLSGPEGLERIQRIRMKMLPRMQALVASAQERGQLRDDVVIADMPLVQLMIGTVIDTARDIEPDLWRRFLAIYLRGLRAEPTAPDPLPHPPLTIEQMQRVMASWQPPRR